MIDEGLSPNVQMFVFEPLNQLDKKRGVLSDNIKSFFKVFDPCMERILKLFSYGCYWYDIIG